MSEPKMPAEQLRRANKNGFLGTCLYKVQPVGLQILTHSLLEFSAWKLCRVTDLFWRLYYPTSEGAILKFSGRSIPLKPNHVYLIAPRALLSSETGNPFRMWTLHFQLDVYGSSLGIHPKGTENSVFEIQPNAELLKVIERACPANPPPEDAGFDIVSIWDLISQTSKQEPNETWRITVKDSRLTELIDLARENLSNPKLLDLLQSSTGLSRVQFYRFMVKETGFSALHLLTELRIERALYLLRNTDVPFPTIATMCGFKHWAQLGVLLKKRENLTPSQIREQAFHKSPEAS